MLGLGGTFLGPRSVPCCVAYTHCLHPVEGLWKTVAAAVVIIGRTSSCPVFLLLAGSLRLLLDSSSLRLHVVPPHLLLNKGLLGERLPIRTRTHSGPCLIEVVSDRCGVPSVMILCRLRYAAGEVDLDVV